MSSSKKIWYHQIYNFIRRELRWLAPGIGVKRWVALILTGTTLLAVGSTLLLLDIYRTAPDNWLLPVISVISLRFLSRPIRVLIFGSIGIGIILWGMWGLNRSLLVAFIKPGRHVVDTISSFRRRERGPRIVVIGGGMGLSALLRGLKYYTNNLKAIVTVADDGGSSGELRKSIGILPPGDIRNCLAALSDDEELITQIFKYRFAAGAGLNGHSLGNLFITALTDITGSFEEAIAESGRVLAVRGEVLPSTLHDVRLVADIQLPLEAGQIQVKGESQIPKVNGRVKRIWLEPNNPLAFPPAIQAILSADLILIGPGSLYTSILPNLLVPDLAEALRSSKALKFYVCNVATQPGETDGYSSLDHLATLEKHLGDGLFDLVICNQNTIADLPSDLSWVKAESELEENYAVYAADLVDEKYPWRHDSKKVSQVIMDLFYERTGPLVYKEEF
ncbi:MAG: YvcK family protein [Anaerolineaceae bacterium]|nr:YvcK family protein [Anaerolineaceae bacterium]